MTNNLDTLVVAALIPTSGQPDAGKNCCHPTRMEQLAENNQSVSMTKDYGDSAKHSSFLPGRRSLSPSINDLMQGLGLSILPVVIQSVSLR